MPPCRCWVDVHDAVAAVGRPPLGDRDAPSARRAPRRAATRPARAWRASRSCRCRRRRRAATRPGTSTAACRTARGRTCTRPPGAAPPRRRRAGWRRGRPALGRRSTRDRRAVAGRADDVVGPDRDAVEHEVGLTLAVGRLDRLDARRRGAPGSTRNTVAAAVGVVAGDQHGAAAWPASTADLVPWSVQPPSPSGVAVCAAWRRRSSRVVERRGQDGVAADDLGSHAACCSLVPNAAIGRAPRRASASSGTGATRRPCSWSTQAELDQAEAGAAVGLGHARCRAGRPWPAPTRARRRCGRSLASISLTRSTRDHAGEDLRGEIADGARSSVKAKSISAPPPGAELRERQLVVEAPRSPRPRHADDDVGGIDADQVGDQPGALLELDDGDDERVVERRDLRVVVDDVAVDGAAAAGLDGVPLERLAVRAHRPGRVAQRLAGEHTVGSAACPAWPLRRRTRCRA